MPFAIKKKETVPDAIRRVVAERLDKATASLNGRKRTLSDEAVHQARKQFKQVRGALRLVRDEIGEKRFERENTTFRDSGRPLSAVRDAKVLVDTLDALLKHFNEVDGAAFRRLRQVLIERRRNVRRTTLQSDHAAAKVARSVKAARKRIADWELQRSGWKSVAGGLRCVYRQGRAAMMAALNDSSDESFHEWRKRAKDLRYNLELLSRAWPEVIEPLTDQVHRLTDLLGEDHDLCVLNLVIRDECDDVCAGSERELLEGLIAKRRTSLQRDALELGRKLYEESEDEFAQRMRGYWKAWD